MEFFFFFLFFCIYLFIYFFLPDNKVSNGVERQGMGERDADDSIR